MSLAGGGAAAVEVRSTVRGPESEAASWLLLPPLSLGGRVMTDVEMTVAPGGGVVGLGLGVAGGGESEVGVSGLG